MIPGRARFTLAALRRIIYAGQGRSYPHGPSFFDYLSSSIVPSEASVTIAEGAISEEAGFNQKSEVLAESVKVEFSRGGDQRMLTQDDDAFSMFSRQPFEPNAEIDFFTGEQLFAEAGRKPVVFDRFDGGIPICQSSPIFVIDRELTVIEGERLKLSFDISQ